MHGGMPSMPELQPESLTDAVARVAEQSGSDFVFADEVPMALGGGDTNLGEIAELLRQMLLKVDDLPRAIVQEMSNRS